MNKKTVAAGYVIFIFLIAVSWSGYLGSELTIWPDSKSSTIAEKDFSAIIMSSYSDSAEFPDSGNSVSSAKLDSLIHLHWELQEGYEWPYAGVDFSAGASGERGEKEVPALFYLEDWGRLVFDFDTPGQHNVAILLHLKKSSAIEASASAPAELLLRYEYFPSKTSGSWLKTSLHSYEIPGWWLKEKGLQSSDFDRENYQAVSKISLQTGTNAPLNREINMRIRNIHVERTIPLVYWMFLIFLVLTTVFAVSKVIRNDGMAQKLMGEHYNLQRKSVHLAAHAKPDNQMVIDFVLNHYADSELSLNLLSERVSLSEKRCSEMIHKHTGQSFRSWLNSLRIEEACKLLVKEKHNVSEIAYAVGYSSPAYFNRMFQKTHQCTPLQYRQNLQKSEKA